MVGLALAILSAGPKGIFENPAYLIGVPLVLLGAIGILLALSPIELRWPQSLGAEAEAELVELPEGHPGPADYIRVGFVLAVGTVAEVAAYYVEMADAAQLAIMLILMVVDFALIALWFMHLRYDNRLFSILFTGGLALVIALFIVVLATLGSNLV